MIGVTPERVLVLDNKDFFELVLRDLSSGRRVTLRATGWSMLPMIWHQRDTLTLGALADDSIRVGNILLVRLSEQRYVIHRLTKIEGETLTLRGDGNPYQIERCRPDEVLAELVAIERNGRILTKAMPRWRLFERFWPKRPWVRRVLLRLYRDFHGIRR